MNKKSVIPIKILAILQLFFLLVYIVYYSYIGVQWGFGERLVLDMISDSIYLLLIPSSIGLLLIRKWGWWMSSIIYVNLFIARVIANLAHLITTLDGVIIDPFNIKTIMFDVSILILLTIIITILFSASVRNHFFITTSKKRSIFLITSSALILYMIHFIFMLLQVSSS